MSTNTERTRRFGVAPSIAARHTDPVSEAKKLDELEQQVDLLKLNIEGEKRRMEAAASLTDPQKKAPVWHAPRTAAEAKALIDQLTEEMVAATGWSRSTCRMEVIMNNKALADLAANPELAPADQGKLWDTNPGGNPLKDPAVYERLNPDSRPAKPVSKIDPKKLASARQAKERLDDLTDQLVKLEPQVSRSAARTRVMAWPANRGLVEEAAKLEQHEDAS